MVTNMFKVLTIMALVSLIIVVCAPRAVESAPGNTVSRSRDATQAANKAAWEKEWDRVTAAARKEGTLSAYVQWGPTTRTMLQRKFKDKFGIDVQFTAFGKGNQLATKMAMERRAGLFLTDVVGCGTTTLIAQMKPAGMIAPIEPILILPEARDATVRRGGVLFTDKDKTVVPLGASFASYVTRNQDFVKEGEITSYFDLLEPRWKGKIIVHDPLVAGTGNSWVGHLSKVWGMDGAGNYLRRLAAQEPALTRDLRLGVEWLAKGKYPLGIALNRVVLDEFIKMGAPVARIKVKEGVTGSPGGGAMALAAGTLAHPNAAKVFVNYLLTQEGQALFSKAYSIPSMRTDVSTEGFEESIPAPGTPFILEDEASLMQRDQLIELAKKTLGHLVK